MARNRAVATVLGLAAACLSSCAVPVHRSRVAEGPGAAEPPEVTLARHGMSQKAIRKALRREWGIAVVTIRDVSIDHYPKLLLPLPIFRSVCYRFEALRIFRYGDTVIRDPGSASYCEIKHWPDEHGGPDELLRKGNTYLVLLRSWKWALLVRAVDVSGLDDPLVLQVQAWLAEAPGAEPAGP